jgi:TrmH RNA methyltransferase
VPAPEKHGDPELERIQGLRAGLAVFARRRDDIVRVMHTAAARRDVNDLVRWASSRRIVCSETTDREIERAAESTHHEGLLLVCRPRSWAPLQELTRHLVQSKGTAVALERVRNPYNVGAILRTAAFFGVDAVLLGAPAPHPALAPTAVRVAEGGAEQVALGRTTDLAETLGRLRTAGVTVVGADAGSATSVFRYAWSYPAVLVLGHEREGLGDRVRSRCNAIVSIPRSGAMDSLNVSTAAGVLVAEMLARR